VQADGRGLVPSSTYTYSVQRCVQTFPYFKQHILFALVPRGRLFVQSTCDGPHVQPFFCNSLSGGQRGEPKVLRREESLEQRSILQREELRASEGGGFFCNFYDCACLLGEPTSRRGVHFRRRSRRHPSRAGLYRILKPARVIATIERSWRHGWLAGCTAQAG